MDDATAGAAAVKAAIPLAAVGAKKWRGKTAVEVRRKRAGGRE